VAVRRLLLLAWALPAAAQEANPAVLGVVAVEREKAVVVAEVVAGTPAAAAGLHAGDRLLSIGGAEIRRAADVDRALAGRKPGDEVRVAYRRGEAAAEARARLAARASVEALRPRRSGETRFEAPPWHAYAWANAEEGKEPSPETTKGKVLVIHAFQSWCPECARRGFPVMKQVEDELGAAADVVLCHLQTVFEATKENTPERGPKEAAKYGIKAPVGFDARVDGAAQSLLMDRFGTVGTSWTIVIDRKGSVRFNGFTPADSKTILALVHDLRKG
jgi:membrane-associated protease RseP (regulator of RpoE activity)